MASTLFFWHFIGETGNVRLGDWQVWGELTLLIGVYISFGIICNLESKIPKNKSTFIIALSVVKDFLEHFFSNLSSILLYNLFKNAAFKTSLCWHCRGYQSCITSESLVGLKHIPIVFDLFLLLRVNVEWKLVISRFWNLFKVSCLSPARTKHNLSPQRDDRDWRTHLTKRTERVQSISNVFSHPKPFLCSSFVEKNKPGHGPFEWLSWIETIWLWHVLSFSSKPSF